MYAGGVLSRCGGAFASKKTALSRFRTSPLCLRGCVVRIAPHAPAGQHLWQFQDICTRFITHWLSLSCTTMQNTTRVVHGAHARILLPHVHLCTVCVHATHTFCVALQIIFATLCLCTPVKTHFGRHRQTLQIMPCMDASNPTAMLNDWFSDFTENTISAHKVAENFLLCQTHTAALACILYLQLQNLWHQINTSYSLAHTNI